jgi:hypothetical protein
MRLTLLAPALVFAACATGESIDGPGPSRPGADADERDSSRPGRDVVDDPEDAAAQDADLDADTTGLDASDADAVADDVDPDGACTGAGCSCVAETASVICGDLACVDGVCCASACDGACEACNVAGNEGSCSPVAAGTDPAEDCATAAGASCGTSGTCDGAGACAFFGDEQTCDDGETCSVADRCDGTGVCRGDVPTTCGPGEGNECCVGSCSDGAGCQTSATTCADVCTPSSLTIGESCAGCGGAGAVGVCGGGTTHLCDASSHSECMEIGCGGTVYRCTEAGGIWAWRTDPACDDGDACTWGDGCRGGSCGGNTVSCPDTTCADRECNGTATCTVSVKSGQVCDDGNLCTYNDRCDATGECGASAPISCVDAPCIDRECNGTSACTESIRTGSSCDDGNLCSWGESCDATGVCVPGVPVSCTGLDTTCQQFACNGTASCGATPRNVGGVCDDGNAATDSDVCRADGSCLGSTGCPPPADACVAGTQNRRGCGGARTISRLAAGAAGGAIINDNTCSARDDWEDSSSCWDANNDHTYRIYLRVGETVTIRYRTLDACIGGSWSGTLQVYTTGGCASTSCGAKVYCDYNESDQTTTRTATQDGWIIIVADGSSAFDDEGDYRLTVTLTCRSGNCACGG